MKLPDGITLPPLSIAVIKLIKTRQSKYGIAVDNWHSLSSGQQQHLKELGVVHSPNHVPVLTKAGEELINQVKAQLVKAEAVFAEIVANLTRKEDREKYPDSVFWLDKDGQFMFKHTERNGILWCSDVRVWLIFKTNFGMNYNEIQSFMKIMVEKYFKPRLEISKTARYTGGYLLE